MKGLGFLIFIIFVIVSNIFRVIQESNKRKAEEQRRAARMAQRNQAMSDRAPAGLPEQRPSGAQSSPPSTADRPQRKKQKQKAVAAAAAAAEREAQEGPRRGDRNRKVGSGVAAHVESYIGEHVKSHIGRDIDAAVKRDITDRVRKNLRSDRVDPTLELEPAPRTDSATEYLSFLKDPRSVRQAMIINEILSRPKILQNRFKK
jgi:flagellar biosynthesis GTPase FlhF